MSGYVRECDRDSDESDARRLELGLIAKLRQITANSAGSMLCVNPRHAPLRWPGCHHCQLSARIEEARALLKALDGDIKL